MKQNIITVNISENNIVFSQFNKTKNQIFLKSYKRVVIDNLELINLSIFKFKELQSFFAEFLNFNEHELSIYISFNGNCINEYILKLTEKIKCYDDLAIKDDKNVWDYIQILENTTENIYLVVGIPFSVLFQYNLLAITNQFNIIQILPETMILMKLAQYLKINFLDNIKLTNEINEYKNFLETNIKCFDIKKIISLDNVKIDNFEMENLFLLKSLGLFLCID